MFRKRARHHTGSWDRNVVVAGTLIQRTVGKVYDTHTTQNSIKGQKKCDN